MAHAVYRGLDIVESVVQITNEEEMMELTGDVECTQILGSNVHALQNVYIVLVPPARGNEHCVR